MDFPQPPQGATGPVPPTTPASTPPPFPNIPAPKPVAAPTPAPTPTTGPMPVTPPPFVPAEPAPQPAAMPTPMMAPQPVQIPVQTHAATGSLGGEEQVYTMPDKFLTSTTPVAVKPKKSNKMLTIILIVAIVLMILAAAGGAAYYFLFLANQQPTTTAADLAVVVNTGNTNEATNATNVNTANTNTANENENGNDNLNTNANANENVNAVTNDNTNVNANENANTNANENVNVNNNTNTTTGTVPPAAKDSDEDTLTNDEEAVWSTKADLPDTDSDGYLDGAEILAGYDPTNATSSGRLADNAAMVVSYKNTEYNYTILYPTNWLGEALNEGDQTEVLFTPNTLDLAGQFIAVTITDNPTGLTALDWYVNTANVEESAVELVESFSGEAGVFSTDRTTVYFADTDTIYAISYRYGNSEELFFPTSFEMMAKSFTLTTGNDKKKN